MFAGFRSFFADENLCIRQDVQPHGLTDVFGMRYSRFTKSGDRPWMELLEPMGCEALRFCDDPHWSAYASFTHHRFGAGHAWYLGSWSAPEEMKEMLRSICEAAGIPRGHVIALQGPFSTELNAAMLRQYDIKYMVSKDGGAPGGFPEKAEAAKETGAGLVVLRRPEEDGLSYETVLKLCTTRLRDANTSNEEGETP